MQIQTGATVTGGQSSRYQSGYDATGNRTSTTVGGVGTTATYNAANEMTGWNIGHRSLAPTYTTVM